MPEAFKSYLWVGLGSLIGGISRFWLSGVVAGKIGGSFPWGTIIVNITGSFVIGVLGGLTLPDSKVDSSTRVWIAQFLITGICGGYTTFSSFSLQTLTLARDGQWLQAGGNIAVSVIVCLAAVWIGFMLGQSLGK